MTEKATLVPLTDSFTNESDPMAGRIISDIRQPLYMIIIYSIAYGTSFLFAFFGNIIVVAVVCKNRRMHTITNLFIVNLAIADILVAVFCIPITLLQSLYNGWRYGAFMCKVTPYLQGVSVCASVNMLAAIAADRYLAICFTLEHKMTWKIAKVIVCIIWLISGVIMLPWLLYHEYEKYIETGIQTFYICTQRWPDKEGPRMFFVAIFILCYTIPLLLIILCYSLIAVRVWNRNAPGIIRYNSVIQKSKVKVVKMLFMVVILFAASWLPLYIIFLVVYFFSPDPGTTTYEILYNSLVPLSQWLGLSNSGMNPIIYFYFSKTIRKRTMALLSCSRSVDNGAYYRRYSSTRCVSVDYTNGQIILRMNNRSLNRSQKVVDSTFYD